MSTITIPAIPYPSEIRPLHPRRRYRAVMLFLLAVAALILLAIAVQPRHSPATHRLITVVKANASAATHNAVVHQPAAHAAKGVTVTVNGTAFACAIPKPPKHH